MKRADLAKLLSESTEEYFTKNGFKTFSDREQIGWKKTDNNNLLSINYGQWAHNYPGSPTTYHLEPIMVISNLEIEKHYKIITTNNSLKSFLDSKTVYAKISDIEFFKTGFFTGPLTEYSWKIDNELDIQNVAPLIIEKVKEVAIPCYNKLNTIEQIDMLYNEVTTFDMFDIYSFYAPNRAIKGLIAAKLIGNPNFETLLNYWSEKAPTWDPLFNRIFQNAVEYLKSNQI